MEFMPRFAPLVVLLFLGTCLALGLAGLVVVFALLRRKRELAKYGLLAALGIAAIYGGVLLAASLASQQKVLRPGEQKYFCEIDCHEAYSVADVATAKTLGTSPRQATAAGTYYIVKVRAWFDERTISSRRPRDLPLTPGARRAVVVDAQDREYPPAAEGLAALEQVEGAVPPLNQRLLPGESYVTALVFDLPPGVQNPRLLISNSDPISHVLIGHENSFLHKKILFALAPTTPSAPTALR